MELRGSCQMRLRLWHAVLFAALILVLGMVAHPRASQAGANDDVEFLQPPGSENGDPDDGGGRRIMTVMESQLAAAKRAFLRLRAAAEAHLSRLRYTGQGSRTSGTRRQ